MNINWYPGHMAKAKRKINEIINLIDIVYELVDSRIPYSSKIEDGITSGKPKILLFTKFDLCDKKITNEWIEYYNKEGYFCLTADLINGNKINEIIDLTQVILKGKMNTRVEKGIKSKRIRGIVVGCPNVGKSTFINKIGKRKATVVGNKAGVTKVINWIKISNELEIMDTPGILMPKLENDLVALNLATMNAIKEEILPIEDVAVHIIKTLKEFYPEKLKERYKLMDISDIDDIFNKIGKNRGCLIKGGEINYEKVCDIVINDIKNGSIKGITFDRFNI